MADQVIDGPFAESKEAIGGYFFLSVSGLEEATQIARQCPGLPYGVAVEVRPVAARHLQQVAEQQTSAGKD